MNTVLLHCCCAPCSSAILEWMLNNEITPVLYYCNPNIYPEEEYLIRKNELTRYAEKLGLRVIDDDSKEDWKGWCAYHNGWLTDIKGMEDEPERGKRCLQCFKIRLLQSAKVAQKEGIKTFTTTLASSRWKSLDQINEAGLWAADLINKEIEDTTNHIIFDTRNWRKGGLQQRRNELLKENGFYNQLYCGCEFSLEAMKIHQEKKNAEKNIGKQ